MLNIGLLTIRNEVDVVSEFLADIEKYFSDVVIMDDSTDGTFEILEAHKSEKGIIKHLVKFNDIYGADARRTDGKKQYLLKYIQDNSPLDETWVTILNADAFFADDPNIAIYKAEAEGANCVKWSVIHFWPTVHDRAEYEKDKGAWLALPIIDRLLRGDKRIFYENLQFKLDFAQWYDVEKHARIIPNGLNEKYASRNPVLLHYPVRSPEQLIARARDRKETGFRNEGFYEEFLRFDGWVGPGMSIWEEGRIDKF